MYFVSQIEECDSLLDHADIADVIRKSWCDKHYVNLISFNTQSFVARQSRLGNVYDKEIIDFVFLTML